MRQICGPIDSGDVGSDHRIERLPLAVMALKMSNMGTLGQGY